MTDLFIERMTVLGRGLVFQPVLVTHTCAYSNNNIIALHNSDIKDFPSKKKKKKNRPRSPPPNPQLQQQKKILANVTKIEQATHKKRQESKSNDKHNRIYLTIDNAKICA